MKKTRTYLLFGVIVLLVVGLILCLTNVNMTAQIPALLSRLKQMKAR